MSDRYAATWELPPRARRIQVETDGTIGQLGTTSACAENTAKPFTARPEGGNYLRVRGEYPDPPSRSFHKSELPPRARRILVDTGMRFVNLGTTSACAENTTPWSTPILKPRNYLRVRGEYPLARLGVAIYRELPPRARRIQHEDLVEQDLA